MKESLKSGYFNVTIQWVKPEKNIGLFWDILMPSEQGHSYPFPSKYRSERYRIFQAISSDWRVLCYGFGTARRERSVNIT